MAENGSRYIGTWALPSGNSADVTLITDQVGNRVLRWAWDRTPLTPDEVDYYRRVLRPQVIVRLGVAGRVLVVDL